MQRHGDLSKTDGSGFDQDSEKFRKSRDVLRGRRGHSDTHLGRTHRQTRLDKVFDCKKRAGLKCKPSKCEISTDSIKYLGSMEDRPGPDAVEAVLSWKAPRTDTQLIMCVRIPWDLPIITASS